MRRCFLRAVRLSCLVWLLFVCGLVPTFAFSSYLRIGCCVWFNCYMCVVSLLCKCGLAVMCVWFSCCLCICIRVGS